MVQWVISEHLPCLQMYEVLHLLTDGPPISLCISGCYLNARAISLTQAEKCVAAHPQTGRRHRKLYLQSSSPFLLLPRSPICTAAISCCLFVVEAVTLKVPLSLHCCHLAWPSTALTANVSPQHASPLSL